MCVYVYVEMHISFVHWDGLEAMTSWLQQLSTPSAYILVSLPKVTKVGFLEKWLIPELGQEKYKMNLEYLTVPVSKEVLKEQWTYVKDTKVSLKVSPCQIMRQFWHQNK